ncbi:TPA: hypothetical protein N0F65_011825 [Lagenidium giganteum]|uniref:Uncharacterized protein n=1 Tax=Lagenidium giganteum TaxID=4803 RepID=A0AAV2YYX7_9STRA|nr:TPA: hypothetical protein N0F65_011825 [Lagenidium giganteum]
MPRKHSTSLHVATGTLLWCFAPTTTSTEV